MNWVHVAYDVIVIVVLYFVVMAAIIRLASQ